MESFSLLGLFLLLIALMACVFIIDGTKYKLSKQYATCGSGQDAYLTSFVSVSIATCADKCVWHPSCMALDYSKHLKLCNLYTKDDIISKGKCIFVKRKDIVAQSSQNDSCANGEACGPSTNQSVNSECEQLSLWNGTMFGNLNTIGSKKRYFCHNRYVLNTTMTSLVCLENGQWSHQPPCSHTLISNVAMGKEVTMSSQYAPYTFGSKMVDGDNSKIWPCACTMNEINPWISVDLGQSYKIIALNIFNRRNCCPARLRSISISVGETMANLSLCLQHLSIFDPVMNSFVLTEPCIGRLVVLEFVENVSNYLTICELELIGSTI